MLQGVGEKALRRPERTGTKPLPDGQMQSLPKPAGTRRMARLKAGCDVHTHCIRSARHSRSFSLASALSFSSPAIARSLSLLCADELKVGIFSASGRASRANASATAHCPLFLYWAAPASSALFALATCVLLRFQQKSSPFGYRPIARVIALTAMLQVRTTFLVSAADQLNN